MDTIAAFTSFARVTQAFGSWTDYISLRRRYRKYARRLQQRNLLSAFNRWCDYVDERCDMKLRVHRVMSKICSRTLATGFTSWHAHYKESLWKEKNTLAANVAIESMVGQLNKEAYLRKEEEIKKDKKEIRK